MRMRVKRAFLLRLAINESCHTWLRHVTYKWVMSYEWVRFLRMSHVPHAWVVFRMNEPCPIWMSHVLYEWVMTHMNESCYISMSRFAKGFAVAVAMHESCPIWMSHDPYEWIMSHMNESFRKGLCCWSRQCMSHVAQECVMSLVTAPCHTRMSHVPYEWVMSHMKESCPIWMRQVSYEWSCPIWMSHHHTHI